MNLKDEGIYIMRCTIVTFTSALPLCLPLVRCRPLTRSPTPHCAGLRTPLTEGSRLDTAGGSALSPKLLAGEGQTAPCCRLAQPTAFCKR